ncbi:hypothetical protein D1007_34741 [Hordeum vulgare]|nr:hypothetical protein D1007_34741 [Hordeum vulgare]
MSSFSSVSSSGNLDSDESFNLPVATQTVPTIMIWGMSIRDHILVTLDYEKKNYGPWHRQFLAPLAKFGLTDHVDDSLAQATSDWVLDDFVVVSWYDAIFTPLTLEIVEECKNSAHSLLGSLPSLFCSNHDACITYLLDKFHSFI